MTAVGTKVFASEYNAIQAAINTVLGIGAGGSGYGQTVLSSQVSTSSSITVAQWSNLRADLLKAYLHQGLPGNLPLPSVPQKTTPPYTIVTYSDYNRYLDLSNVVTANAGITPPAGQATLQTFSSGSYTSAWNGQLTHLVVLTFATADQARFYFNSGGNIQFSASLINYPGYPGYGAQSASYAKNSDWNMLLNNMGTTTFGKNSTVNSGNGTGQTILSAVGYFQLTTGEQNIYRKTTSDASYTPNQYDLYANIDVTGAIITFNIRFKDLATISGHNASFAIDENVEGSLTSLVQGYYASGSYVAATPPATTATFAGGIVAAPPPYVPPPPIYEPPPPVVITYNEIVTAPTSVQGTGGAGQTDVFTMTISGGAPNTNYSYTRSLAGSGSGVLNGLGAATLSLTHPNNITAGTFIYTFSFTGSGNTRTVNVAAVAAPPAPSYGPFYVSPNPASNGQTITLTATVYNISLTGNLNYTIAAVGADGQYALQNQGVFTGSGTQTITGTFTFQQAKAPYTTFFNVPAAGNVNAGPAVTLYVAPVVTPSSYGSYGWSPVGPVAVGTTATFSAVANNAIGDIYGIGIGILGSTTVVTGIITTNPQTITRTITAAYDASYPYYNGIFNLNSLLPDSRNVLLTVNAPVVTPPAPTYSVSGGGAVNEGSSLAITVDTTNVPNGTTLYWQLTSTITGLTPEAGASDFGATSGSFNVVSNLGLFGIPIIADSLTEETEFKAVRVYSDAGFSNQIGYVVFNISDTSQTPPPAIPASYGAYGWSPAGPVANGTSATFSATVLNAVGLGYSITTINNGVQGPTTSGTVTTNPQTFSQTISVIYNSGISPSGIFFLSGQTGTVTSTITVNAPIVYNESVTGPSSVTVGNAGFNIQISGGAPNTGYSWTGATSGSGTLNGSGSASVPFVGGGTINSSPGTYTYTVTFAASGNTRTYSVTVNAAPPPAITYNESLSGPSSAVVGVAFTVYITGGAPNTGFTWSGDASGSATLDGSGNGVFNNVVLPTARSYSWTFVFAASGNSRTFSITASPAPEAVITSYGFSDANTPIGGITFFYGTVANAVGRNWAMGIANIPPGSSTANYLPTATGTITQNPQSITYPFMVESGYTVGTFIVDGIAYVQSSFTR